MVVDVAEMLVHGSASADPFSESGAVSQENIDQYVTVPKASTKALHSAAFR